MAPTCRFTNLKMNLIMIEHATKSLGSFCLNIKAEGLWSLKVFEEHKDEFLDAFSFGALKIIESLNYKSFLSSLVLSLQEFGSQRTNFLVVTHLKSLPLVSYPMVSDMKIET